MTSSHPYCDKLGFDEHKIQRRLAFLYLSDASHQLAQRLHHEVIEPNIDRIIDQFYEMLLYQPESRRILTSGELIQRLKKTQSEYLMSLGIGFDSQDYFEERLHVGLTHAWVGIPLGVYQCAYRGLTQIIIDAMPPSISAEDNKALIGFLLKITTLDMSLAIETYHSSQVSALEEEVTRIASREGELRVKASTDSLTGLMNHENSFLYLEQAITKARESRHPLSVMMADLDYFKRINDTHGHLVGDAVLQEVAARIQASVREPDEVGRYGGEEFIVTLTDTDAETAKQIAERIRSRIASAPISVHGELISITISVGTTSMLEEDDLSSLVKRADEALYAAKDAGRDRVISH